MHIAIAASGLGHVSRGIEAWAAYLGEALHARGEHVTLFRAAGEPTRPYERLIPCWKRTDDRTARLLHWLPRRLTWRLGLASAYEVEQTTFALNLLGQLRELRIDVLHVKDPQLALLVQRAGELRIVPTRVILSHGTEEPPDFLKKITYLHHLSPAHEEEARAAGASRPTWRMISNFIDTDRFRPAGPSPQQLRQELDIPAAAIVVLCAAAIKREHKRIDYLLDEWRRAREAAPNLPLWFIAAGGRDADTDELIDLGRRTLGDRVRFLANFPLDRMPDLYRAVDLFVLCSLKEMLGTVLLEASASEVPCLVHRHPSMQWVIGPGGRALDMTRQGAAASAIVELAGDADQRRDLGRRARQHCIETFGRERIVDQYLDYYRDVTASDARGGGRRRSRRRGSPALAGASPQL
jgi:glycosyltransferase involved in cell wall biosynthesis